MHGGQLCRKAADRSPAQDRIPEEVVTVHVGSIAIRSGMPHDVDRWGWRCGLYPLSFREGGTAPACEACWSIAPIITAATLIAVSGDRRADDLRLSDIEPRFTCTACGKRGADIRPDFNWKRKPVAMLGYR